MVYTQFLGGTIVVHGAFYSGRNALRVISRGEQWLAVYRAHQVTRRAFCALRVIQRQEKFDSKGRAKKVGS